MSMTYHALFVEDDESMQHLITSGVQLYGTDVILDGCTTLADALVRLGREAYDVVILDLTLADARGLAGLQAIKLHHPQIPVVVFTGRGNGTLGDEAMLAGASDYVVKGNGFDIKDMVRRVRYAAIRESVRRRFTPMQDALESAIRKVGEMQVTQQECGDDK